MIAVVVLVCFQIQTMAVIEGVTIVCTVSVDALQENDNYTPLLNCAQMLNCTYFYCLFLSIQTFQGFFVCKRAHGRIFDKGLVHPKMQYLLLLAYLHVVPNLTFVHSLNTTEDVCNEMCGFFVSSFTAYFMQLHSLGPERQ